jgi:hypothetical protein
MKRTPTPGLTKATFSRSHASFYDNLARKPHQCLPQRMIKNSSRLCSETGRIQHESQRLHTTASLEPMKQTRPSHGAAAAAAAIWPQISPQPGRRGTRVPSRGQTKAHPAAARGSFRESFLRITHKSAPFRAPNLEPSLKGCSSSAGPG